MICTNCGANIPKGFDYCPDCNAPTPSIIEEAIFINGIFKILNGD